MIFAYVYIYKYISYKDLMEKTQLCNISILGSKCNMFSRRLNLPDMVGRPFFSVTSGLKDTLKHTLKHEKSGCLDI